MRLKHLFFLLILFSFIGCHTTKIALTEKEKDAMIQSWRLSNPNPWMILYEEDKNK